MVATERIWRVKTRICNIENFSYDKKFPVLLRSDNHYAKLIALKSHEDASHSGVNTTLNFVPLNFWIITGTQTIKNLETLIYINIFVQGKVMVSLGTPALPEFRLQCNHSFKNVRVDFPCALYCKERDEHLFKVYILFYFICDKRCALRNYLRSWSTIIHISYL